MNEDIVINPDHPDLYKFLYLCVIEQRGIHTIGDIDINAREGHVDDITFLKKYVNLELTTLKHKTDTINFLIGFLSYMEDNLMVGQTRDCQVIETGNHYVILSFKTKKDDHIYNICFSIKFKQSHGCQPEKSNEINVSYSRDCIINQDVEKECQQKDHISRHCISIGKNTRYNRTHISKKTFNINDEIIKQLPCSYLIPQNHTIEPKLNPDACILS
jgi:hypothetical protein